MTTSDVTLTVTPLGRYYPIHRHNVLGVESGDRAMDGNHITVKNELRPCPLTWAKLAKMNASESMQGGR